MKRFLILTVAGASLLLGYGPVYAQVGTITGAPAPLGITSPLGMGPGMSVGPTGIPLGATELATPGVSPAEAGTSALGSMTAAAACSGIGASAQPSAAMAGSNGTVTGGTAAPTALFDSTGLSGTASGTCAGGVATMSSSANASASSPGLGSRSTVGRVGIPLGATELATGGVSPLPDIVVQSQPPLVSTDAGMAPCTLTGSSTSMSSGGC